MAKKARMKGKDDGKPGKGGGNKPIKVVTFDTSKKGSHQLSVNSLRSFCNDP